MHEANQGTVAGQSGTNTIYLRVPAWTFISTSNNKTPVRSWWIPFSEIYAVATAAGVLIQNNWITTGAALYVETGTGNGSTPNYGSGTIYPSASVPTLTTAAGATPPQPPRFYAVTINTLGNIIGISTRFTASGQTGGVVNTSCWNSFKINP